MLKVTLHILTTFFSFLSLLLPVWASADDTHKNQPVPTKQGNNPAASTAWLESVHSTLAGSVFHSASWFDNFFADHDSEQLAPTTNLRISVGWTPKKGDWQTIDSRFRLSVKLPHFSSKLDLVFSDDDTTINDGTDIKNITTPPEDDFESFTAAIRYVHTTDFASLLDSRLGVSGNGLFYRTRYKKRIEWLERHSAKFEPSIYYFITTGFGSKLLLAYNYHISTTEQYQLSAKVKNTTVNHDIEWVNGFHKFTQISDHSASFIGVQMNGLYNKKHKAQVRAYSVSYKYRINAVRKWLFFEVEPFYEWLDDNNFHGTPGIALRVEGYFMQQ